MSDDTYFEGEPDFDSTRRHMERVLKGEPRRRRWPWILAVAAGGAWTVWRLAQGRPASRDPFRTGSLTPPDGKEPFERGG